MNIKRLLMYLVLVIAIAVFTHGVTAFAANPLSNVFSDTGSHWAKENICYLTDNGAIKGYTDGTFKPENKISRAEFTAILLRALKTDVGQPKEGKWYDNYIAEAANRKYIVKDEFDSVEKDITRGEIARMIVRAMTEEYPGNMADYADQLKDYSKIPAAYKDFVLKAYVKGIITGRPGGVFAHADTATRAEATTMIVRLIDESKRVIPAAPVNNDIYVKDPVTGQDAKVTTSHKEILPHLKKILDVLAAAGGYTDAVYAKTNNHVQFLWYKDKADFDKPIEIRTSAMGIDIFLEKDPDLDYYLPYQVSLLDVNNAAGSNMLKTLMKDIFQESYDKVINELDKKIKDINYQGKIWEKINGREVRAFTFSGYHQIDVYMELEKK